MEDNQNMPKAPDFGETIKNMKAETDRKLANLEATIQNSLASLPNIIQQQMQASQPTSQASTPQVDPYEDPQGYQDQLLQKVAQIIDSKTTQAIQSYENRSLETSSLYSEFPELSDASHDMTQAVIQRYQSLSPEQRKDSTQHLKSIVYQVASEKGIRPKQYRDAQGEDFSLGARSGEKHVAPKKEPEKFEGIDKGSQAWAEILKSVGAPIDLEKPEDVQKLQQYSKRTNWTTVAGSPEFKRGGNK